MGKICVFALREADFTTFAAVFGCPVASRSGIPVGGDVGGGGDLESHQDAQGRLRHRHREQ